MTLISKNVMVGAKRTSMRLEQLMWDALGEIGRRERVTVNDLITGVAEGATINLTSDVRVFVADYFRRAATELGHAAAGHGSGGPLEAEAEVPMRKAERRKGARRAELVA